MRPVDLAGSPLGGTPYSRFSGFDKSGAVRAMPAKAALSSMFSLDLLHRQGQAVEPAPHIRVPGRKPDTKVGVINATS